MEARVRTRHIQLNEGLSREGGFTLVEMLVAIIVGLLVLGGAHQVFVAGVTTQTTTSSQMEVDRRAQVAMDELARGLRQAGQSLTAEDPSDRHPILDDLTQTDRIAFAGPPGADMEPPADGNGVIHRRYWLQSDGAGAFNLMRMIGGNGYTGGIVLARGVQRNGLVFTFYNASGSPTNLARETTRVYIRLTIRDGANWTALQSTVKLRNYVG